jgi:hypothetical protein
MKRILLVTATTLAALCCTPAFAEVNVGIALGIPGVSIDVPGVMVAPPPMYYEPDDDGYVVAPPPAVLLPAPPVVYGPRWERRRHRGDDGWERDHDWREHHHWRHHDDQGDDD